MLHAGVDTGGTALHHAVRVDQSDGLLVGALLESPETDVEATDSAGRTPLGLAADLDASTQIIKRLLAAGCFVNRYRHFTVLLASRRHLILHSLTKFSR